MSRSDPISRDGFTLIEVLAAFVLIAIILPTVAKGISVCVRAEAQARALVEAAALADAKLSELVSYVGWEGQTLSGDFSPERPECQWAAESIFYDDNLMEVRVVVTWMDVTGERTWSISTLLYRGTTS